MFLSRVCFLAACAALLPAQDYDVRLEPKDRVLAAGTDLRLVLTIDVKKDADVPATLLSGMNLTAKVGEQTGAEISEVPGTVKLTAGTKVQRLLTLPGARLPATAGGELADVTIGWKDLPSATAVVKLAPDTSKIALADLDLTKTKVMLMTNYGPMVVRFFPEKAPEHVKNFVKLAKDRFYDGTRFHRVIKGFMLQGGCPNTKEGATGQPGTGNTGTFLKAEFNDTKHERGILSTARGPNPDSASCQFFVLHGVASHLDNQYTAFGVLDSGFDTLDKIADVRVKMDARGEASVPVEPVHLYNAIVLPVLKSK